MAKRLLYTLAWGLAVSQVACSQKPKQQEYTNPILPGWNTDPSCTFVKELDNTFFCTTSSFLAFPGIPVFASKDLVNWRHASNALTKEEQLPELSRRGLEYEGIWASTLRYRKGMFYLITTYVSWIDGWGPIVLLFTTKNPYDDSAWSGPIRIENPANDIDPDIFWDDDGKVYMAVAAGIYVSEVDINKGTATEPFKIWNGTGDRNPEGPHFYKKDNWYYLLIGEGGTELNHTVTIARSRNIRGTYKAYEDNPILTAKNTEEWFQTVGHADLFQDASGNWWGVALATRSGPEWEVYPMGRETVLVPVQWKENKWPSLDMVRGKMSGPLPPTDRQVPGTGAWVDAPDKEDFAVGSSLPRHWFFWRPPKQNLFTISPEGHPNTLRVLPSRVNLTADEKYDPVNEGLGFLARKQTASVFTYSIDLLFDPKVADEEAGITVFLTQTQHIDISIINVKSKNKKEVTRKLRFKAETSGKPDVQAPETRIRSIPQSWLKGPIRLAVTATRDHKYEFSASSAAKPHKIKKLGYASAEIVSGGNGPFTGTIVGVFATKNGGKGKTPAYFSRWRYTAVSQEVGEGRFVPA
ncbi:hypothetical protein BFJ68_g15681 [Fusarium oxysporum]|uniref:Beta-xylosidase C-terminal Concanavalin A-like domain-containing protein n=1 Tax=Fusarium oxysporum TaxID=5507 RepID=A0A420PKT6_FUSOX|nr:hypothetical protein BFJ68_g15681 [Fusarium oxysporum]